MIFTEPRFLIFLAVVFAVHWALSGETARKIWLLAASQVFFAAWDWRFLSLIWASILADYTIALAMTRRPQWTRGLLLCSLVVNLGLLGFFKYWNFFIESGTGFAAWLGLPVSAHSLAIILPIGISFYTFQTLSYTIDVARGKIEATRSLLDFSLFVSFFPQLVAGPIVRASHFLPQLAVRRTLRDVDVKGSLALFLVGFVKKACVADQAARVVDAVFADPGTFDAAGKWLASLLYSLQIYCDFSGYSDMAIGAAGLLGYRLILNFDAPYLAVSMKDFWRRWHISLSTWFRDYLYIPLGGNRLGAVLTARNLWIVFFLCGLWHGANWTFVVWGLWHGAFLVLERWLDPSRLSRWLGRLYVLLVANLGFVVFRSPDLAQGWRFVRDMFLPVGGAPAVDLQTVPPWWWAVLLGYAVIHAVVHSGTFQPRLRALPGWAFAVAFAVALALVLPWVAVGYRPFIYFQF